MDSSAAIVSEAWNVKGARGGVSSQTTSGQSGKSRRIRERVKLMFPVRVFGRADVDKSWDEMTRLIDVTPFGARFILNHMVEPGQLLNLLMPMPRALRCFDHAEEHYRVWAIVRNIKLLADKRADGSSSLEVGVAFISKHPPASYASAPQTRYDITLSHDAGCKRMVSEKTQAAPGQRSDDTRLNLPMEVRVELLDPKGQVANCEETVTENISRRGTAVFTRVKIERGRFCLVTDVRSGLRVLAVVRACRTGKDNIHRLHLEFLDNQWPLDGLT